MAINFVDGKYVDEKGLVKLDPTVYADWQIAEEAEDQANAVDHILGTIEDISNIVSNNSATSEESSAAGQELSNQATNLNNLLGKFKYKKS